MLKKRILPILLSFILVMGILPANIVFADFQTAETESDENYNPADWIDDSLMHENNSIGVMSATKVTNRYTVLTLDVSGSMGSSEMSKMKEASIAYCNKIISSRGNNYVAVVKFGSSASLACGFTNSIDDLTNSINSLYSGGGTDTAGGLRKAKEIYDLLGAANITERNVILFSDGEPNSAYDAQNVAKPMWSDYNIYTIGYNLGTSGAAFMQSIQNCGYYNVLNSEDIQTAVNAIADQILAGASGNINNFLGNETTVTVYENTKSPSAMTNDFRLSSGAEVTVNNQTYTTGNDGTVKIPTVTSGSLTVSKKNYVTKTVSASSINISGKVYLEKDEGDNPIINGVFLNSVNLLYDEYGMDLTKNNEVTLSADVTWKKGSAQSLYLVQEARRENFVNDKLSIVFKDKFDISKDIYVVAIDSYGNTTKKKLNIVLSDNVPDAVKGFKFSMGEDMGFTLPEATGFLAGSKVGVGISSSITELLPIEVAVEDNKVYISIGVDIVNYTNEDKYATNASTKNRAHVLTKETKTCVSRIKDIYEDITTHSGDLLDTSNITKGARKLKYFKETYRNSIKYPRGSFGVEADFTLLGFGEGYIDSDGKFQWIDGGVILCPSASVNWGGQFAIGPVPAYWEASIAASIEAKMNLYMNASTKQFTPNGDISGTLSASIGAGAGVKKVLSLGGGITGTLSPLWRMYFNQPDYFRLDAKLNGYFKVTVIGFEYKYDTKKLKLEGTWIEHPSPTKLTAAEQFDVYDSSQYVLIDREYAKKPSQFLPESIRIMSDSIADNEKIIKTNIYPYSAPQTVKFNDGSELIVWLDDVNSRSDINRTALYYTYFKDGVYSEPQTVEDDGTADFYPYLYCTNNTAYLAWNNEKTVMSDSDTMDEMLKNLEIKSARFDAEAGEFKDVLSVTDNSTMDIKPILFGDSNIYCTWISNDANSIDVYSGYNVMLSELNGDSWEEPKAYADNLNSIDSIAGTVIDGTPHIAYCVDTDGDISTTEDIKLSFDYPTKSIDGINSNVVCGRNSVYMYGGGNILEMNTESGITTSVSSDEDMLTTDNFKVFSNDNGNKAVVFAENNGLYSELYGYIYNPYTYEWSRKVQLTDLKENIDDFDGFIDDTGNLTFIVNKNKVIGDYENGNLYGEASLVRLSTDDSTKLEIKNIVYDENFAVEGNDIDISVIVKNNGTKDESFTAEIVDADSNQLTFFNVPYIAPGETTTVDIPLPVEEYFIGTELKVIVSTDDFSCEDTFTLNHEDLSLENTSYSKTNDGKAVISVDLVNRGYGNGDNVTVSLREDSADGNVLSTETVSVSELLDCENVNFEVDNEAGKIYYVTIDSDDSTVSNNSDFVIFENDSFRVENNQVTILLAEDMTASSIAVPGEINGLTVTKIGDSAYESCENAKSITIPDTVTEIGDRAFANCISLENISIPKNVTKIGSDAFKNCTSLTRIDVDGENTHYRSIDGVLFEINEDGTLTLMKFPEKKAGSYNFPDNVTDISSYAFENCTQLDSVEIPALCDDFDSVYVFKGCTDLKTAEFKGKINKIPDGMFFGCTSLESVIVPDGAKSIGTNAFADCQNLGSLTIADTVDTVEKGAFSGCNALEKITVPYVFNGYLGHMFGASSYSENASYVPQSLTELVLTNKDSVLTDYALYNCSNLLKVEVNNETIANNAFCGCSNLNEVIITYKVINISSPFSGCPSTMVITGYNHTAAQSFAENNNIEFNMLEGEIPHEVYKSGMCGYDFAWTVYYDHVMELSGAGAMPNYSYASSYPWYNYNSYISEVQVNEGVTSIGAYAFSSNPYVNKISLPNTLKTIKNNAFEGNTALTDIAIPSHVTVLGSYAFRNCTALSSVLFGENVEVIGNSCFANDTALTEITLPDSVISIDVSAFYSCTALSKLSLSNKLSSIGDNAFCNCISLEEVKLPYTVTSISSSAFSGHVASFVIKGYKESYAQDYAANNSITFEAVDGDIPNEIRVSGSINDDITWDLYYDGTLIIGGNGAMPSYSSVSGYPWYNYRDFIKRINISGITSIGSYAFEGYSQLKKVTIGSSVKRMGTCVFRNCVLLSDVLMSNNTEYINTYDFYGCTSLKEIYVPSSVSAIYGYAFGNCTQLNNVILNEKLKEIQDNAFINCTAITKIEIPYTVVTISKSAFSNHLADMVIKGYRDSYAQDYAEDNKISFEALEAAMPDEIRASGTIGNDITWELTYDGTLTIKGIGAVPNYSNASYYGYYSYNAFIKKVVIEKDVLSVGNNMFNGYSRLREVSLPDGLLSIGAYAFNNCRLIKEITIPDTVTVINVYAFNKCSELTEVNMSDNIQTINARAFGECVILSDIMLPYTVVFVDADAFYEHSSVFKITGYGNTYAQNYAEQQNIPFEDIGESVPDTERASGKFGDDFKWSLSYNGTLSIEGTGAMPSYGNASSYGWYNYRQYITRVSINGNITSIGNHAFESLTNVTQVDMCDNIAKIGDYAFASDENLTSVDFSENLNSIGAYAFSGCNRFADVNLPDGLNTIKDYAFNNCTAISNILIPYTVTQMYSTTFNNCVAAMVIRGYSSSYAEDFAQERNIQFEALTDEMPDTVFAEGTADNGYKWSLKYNGELTISGRGTMPNYSEGSTPWYQYSNYIRKVIIQDGVTTVGNYAFAALKKLKSVNIPGSVKTIETGAFRNNTALTNVNISSGVTVINSYAFSGCTALKTIVLPESLVTLQTYAFSGCGMLSEAIIGASVNAIGDYCFSGTTELKSIILPPSVTSIGNNTFYNHVPSFKILCYDSTYAKDYAVRQNISYEILDSDTPDGVLKQGSFDDFEWSLTYTGLLTVKGVGVLTNNASSYWSDLSAYIKALKVCDGVTGIGDYTFNNLYNLKTVELASTVRSIGNYAFDGDTSLENIDFGSVSSIGMYAFRRCTSLKTAAFSDKLQTIDNYAFSGCNAIENIELPAGVNTIGERAFENCSNMEYITIPYTVTNINSSAFTNHINTFVIKGFEKSYAQDFAAKNNIKFECIGTASGEIMAQGNIDADFKWSLSYSGELAIDGIGAMPDLSSYAWQSNYSSLIKKVTLSDTITSVGNYLCSGLTNLTEVSLPRNIKKIGNYAFNNCSKLKTINIPKSVDKISANAFERCSSLDDVYFNSALTVIENNAFNSCSSIKTVYYGGSETAWQNISVGNNTYISNANIIYNADNISYVFKGYRQGKDFIISTIRNLNGTNDDIVVSATYKDGNLISLKKGGYSDIIEMRLPFNEGETAKCFVWNKNMTPYINIENHIYTEVKGGYQDVVLETPHNYYNGMNEWYIYEYDGDASSIDVTFCNDTMTEGCDYIRIYDCNNNHIGDYSGNYLAGKTINIPGNMVKINFTTDGSVVYYGFKTESIYVNP